MNRRASPSTTYAGERGSTALSVELVEQLFDEHRAGGRLRHRAGHREGVPRESLGFTGTEVLRIAGEEVDQRACPAEARRVRIRVWSANCRPWVEVSDHGRGFDTASPVSPIHQRITGLLRAHRAAEPAPYRAGSRHNRALGGAGLRGGERRCVSAYGSYAAKTGRRFASASEPVRRDDGRAT